MTTLRTAAQQVLDALTDFFNAYPHMAKGYTEDAITALKAALAESADDEMKRKSDAIQRLWKERDELRTLNAELVEALKELDEKPEHTNSWLKARAAIKAAEENT